MSFVLVQWARLHPRGWERVALTDWRSQPKAQVPRAGRRRTLDDLGDEPGWIVRIGDSDALVCPDDAKARAFRLSGADFAGWMEPTEVIASAGPTPIRMVASRLPDEIEGIGCTAVRNGTSLLSVRFVRQRTGWAWVGRVYETLTTPRAQYLRLPGFVIRDDAQPDYQQDRARLKYVLEKDGPSFENLLYLSHVEIALGDLAESREHAEQSYRRAATLDQQYLSLIGIGAACEQAEMPLEASGWYFQAYEKISILPDACAGLARCYGALGRDSLAAAWSDKAQKRSLAA